MRKDNDILTSEHRILQFGSKKIRYELCYQERKTLGIRVYPDSTVKVIAPLETSEETLNEKLKKKAPWILKQQNDFLAYQPFTPSRQYINGETHLYLGRQYRLSIINEQWTMNNTPVKLERGRIFIFSSTHSKENIASILDKWYRERAKEWFEKLLPVCQEKFPAKYQPFISNCTLSIQKMPTRWGSCTAKGKIMLNPELIKASKGSIEYVIIHELCHLMHHNHTKAFYDLQEKIMPDWKKWKERLETSLT